MPKLQLKSLRPLLDIGTLADAQVTGGLKGSICGDQDLASLPEKCSVTLGQEHHVPVKLHKRHCGPFVAGVIVRSLVRTDLA